MALLFSQKVYSAGVSGVATVYTDPSLNSALAQAEKYDVQLRLSMATGTSQSVSVTSELSNDGIAWTTKKALIAATPVTAANIVNAYGQDDGVTSSTVGGALMRLNISMTGTSPSANVEVWIVGRSND